jgi:hypothetical protein
LATALLGTEQRKCTVVAPEIEFLNALESIDAEKNHETWVLLASAYTATYRRAGQMPQQVKPSQMIAPAPTETKRTCSTLVAARLAALLGEARTMEPFLDELLIELARKERLVPPTLLPDLLTWGKRSKQRRALLVPVVGERGHWLAQHNPEWKNALRVEAAEGAEQAGTTRIVSSQQALYDVLHITDNIFSKTYSIFKGQGLSGHGRLIQQVMDKVLTLSKAGGTYYTDPELVNVAVAAPPAILPEVISRIHKALASGGYTWLSRLAELLEFRHQMLEELNDE